MYSVKVIIKMKENVFFKESYEKTANIIRTFIQQNDGNLKKEHYKKVFSYYTFDQLRPFESEKIYKKDGIYTFEIKTIKEEFKDMRKFKGLETNEMKILDVTFSKIYYQPKGYLKTQTPIYIGLAKLQKNNLEEYKEKIRENLIFKFLKNGNEEENIDELRKNTVDEIIINNKMITIPFPGKKNNKGEDILYHCYNIEIKFKDNDNAKKIEQLIFGTGIGKMTSNGFGYME